MASDNRKHTTETLANINKMEEKIISILVQGGLASVALVSLYFNYKIVSNHLVHANDAIKELSVVIGELREAIKNHFK